MQAPPLLAVLLLKNVAKVSAVLSGRVLRNWWKSLPKNRSEGIRAILRRNIGAICGAIAGLCGLSGLFYFSHLETTPITYRKRFLVLTKSQLQNVVELEYQQHLEDFEDDMLPPSHPVHKMVEKITCALLQGNQDLRQIKDKTWTLHIVNRDLKNAFVLPNGHIFVFTGLLKAASNEQQLGIVLAHEIAHVVLNHAAEQLSYFEFLDFLLIILLGAIWTILPNDGLAIVATWFKSKVVELLLEMPYSRLLETEADEVGLHIAAKACLDVRESKVFWERMAKESTETDVPFLSTHPSHLQRAKHLERLIPQAMKVREYCGCASLPVRDSNVGKTDLDAVTGG